MEKTPTKTIGKFLLFGILLALAKLLYLFFDAYNLMDLAVFTLAGYFWGSKLGKGQKAIGLILAVPSICISLYFISRLGIESISNGVGVAHLLALVVIPLAIYLGIFLRRKRDQQRSV